MGMFDKTPVIAAPKKVAKKKSKPEHEISGIEQLAMIDALQKSLEALRASVEVEVKDQALAIFMDEIQENGKKPENFKGIEGNGFASMQLRRKASNIALSDEAVELLTKHGIKAEKAVIQQELFTINPAYANNAEMLKKVEKAIKTIVPEDFIQHQPEVSKFVVTEDILDTAFQTKAPVEVFKVMTTISCGPKLEVTDLKKVLGFVSAMLEIPMVPADAAKKVA